MLKFADTAEAMGNFPVALANGIEITKKDNSKLGQAVQQVGNRINGAKKKINGFRNSTMGKRFTRYTKKGLTLMAGTLGAAAMYATGTSGALESFAAGKRIKGTTQKALGGYGDPKNAAAKAAIDLEQEPPEEYKEATDTLEKLGLSEEEMNDTENLNEKADEAENEYEETRDIVAQEIKDSKIEALNDKINKLRGQSGKRERIQKLKQERAELEGTKLEKYYNEADKDDRVKAADEKAVKARNQIQLIITM